MDFLGNTFTGIFGIIHLIIFIWAIIQIISGPSSILHKILWILLVGLLPVIGLILYLLFGRK